MKVMHAAQFAPTPMARGACAPPQAAGSPEDEVTLSQERPNIRPVTTLLGAAAGGVAVAALNGFSPGTGGFAEGVMGVLWGGIAGGVGAYGFTLNAFEHGSADEAVGSAFAGILGAGAGAVAGATLGAMGYNGSALLITLGVLGGGAAGYKAGALYSPKGHNW